MLPHFRFNNAITTTVAPLTTTTQTGTPTTTTTIEAMIRVSLLGSQTNLRIRLITLAIRDRIWENIKFVTLKVIVHDGAHNFNPSKHQPIKLLPIRFQTRLGTIFSDNGGECITLRGYLTSNGISHFTSSPHTPEHNGVSERRHRHIIETGLTLLSIASIPTTYWTYAFATAVYLINQMPTSVISMRSPYQQLFQQSPNYKKLRIFGCLCFQWLTPYTNHKLDARSLRCVFLYYSTTQSAYFCLHLPTERIYTSRHVLFDEHVFPFQTMARSQVTNRTEDSSPYMPSSVVSIPLH